METFNVADILMILLVSGVIYAILWLVNLSQRKLRDKTRENNSWENGPDRVVSPEDD
jgi:hypothetical protein